MIGIRAEVDKITKNIGRQVVSRGYRAVNAIRNAEQEVLNGKGGGRTAARKKERGAAAGMVRKSR